MTPLSNCCKAEMKASIADEGTGCYMCDKCGKPCDAAVWEDVFDMLFGENSYYGKALVVKGITVHQAIKSFLTTEIYLAKEELLNSMLAECDRTENEGGRVLVEKFMKE